MLTLVNLKQGIAAMVLPVAQEDYLKLIYKLLQRNRKVTLRMVAAELEVSAPAVTKMVRKLQEKGLLKFDRSAGVRLTDTGRQAALRVVRGHRLIEVFLHDFLGYTWDEVHEEAEQLEHVLSDRFKERLFIALGSPTHDPHGDPIPDSDLKFTRRREVPLSKASSGFTGIISRVHDDDPDALKRLAGYGMYPGAKVTLLQKGNGNRVRLELNGKELELPDSLARAVMVSE
jgi:DtxR family Mn-dependent transcriptional regulator